MTTSKQKEPVRLRTKSLTNGNRSLYLDIYIEGARRYEFLKLYLVPEKSREDKERNRETYALANSIKAQRIVEIQAGKYGFTNPQADKILFFEYVKSIIEKKVGTTKQSWEHCYAHLRIYEPKDITFKDVTQKWVEGFRKYLDERACAWDIDHRKRIDDKQPLGDGTKALYFQKLSAILNSAVKDDIIPSSPMKNVERFTEPESNRQYLTIEEVRQLAESECPNETLKRAFLFSCLTGLRWSDITQITWGEIEQTNGNTRIIFRQQKTSSLEYLDISEQAAELMGERGRSDECVFGRFLTPQVARIFVKAWVKASGIKKHITFHCARHTFAVMMLDLGVDIYTLSKLLGHKNLESTQVYAKILDKNKRAAVARIPNIFNSDKRQQE
jgi:integrase